MPLPKGPPRGETGIPRVRHEDCWAKTIASERPGISVAQHCRTAGTVARLLSALQPPWLAGRLNVQAGVALAALHDIGKVAPGFQGKCAAWVSRHDLTAADLVGVESDHARIGQRTLQEILHREDLRFWAAIVGAHHGRIKGDHLPPLCDGGPAWEDERRRLAGTLIEEFGPLPQEPVPSNHGALWFNAGLIAVADWLASDDRAFPPSKELDAAEIRDRAQRHLAQVGFRPVSCVPNRKFADLFPFPPRALQTAFTEIVRKPGVYVVEAPMGCGKTEAALMAAYNLLAAGEAAGIYFALPTQTTSNRIHVRVGEFVERLAPGARTRLIHGSSWLQDSEPRLNGRQETSVENHESPHDGRDWFASSRRPLVAPFGVGTVDQALLGVVAAKHFFVRQFGLAGKVVILDEVHSYDLYTGTLIDHLVRRLRELGATVIILSATLTSARRAELLGLQGDSAGPSGAEYPLVSASLGDPDDGGVLPMAIPVARDSFREIGIRFETAADLPAACLERAERGECVLWIRNTVNDAQDTYRLLCAEKRQGGPEIGLLHARFPQFRREELEIVWLDRLGKDQTRRPGAGCVLVATQVAEQSVDIDADLLITDLAPTDMLLQRIGRLWRHDRPRPPGCTAPETLIALPALDLAALRSADVPEIRAALGRSARVYAPYVLMRTLALWRDLGSVSLPADIRRLLEATYAEAADDEPPSWRELRATLEHQKARLRHRAIANSNPWQVALDDEEGIQTRWGGCPTVAVLLVAKVVAWDAKTGARLVLPDGAACEPRADQFDYNTAKAIHRNLVKVPRWSVRSWLGHAPRWLRDYVTGEVVACKVRDGGLTILPDGSATGIEYREDLGVVIPPWQPDRQEPREEEDESYDW